MGAEPSFVFQDSHRLADEPGFVLDPDERTLVRGRVRAGWGRRTPLGHVVVTNKRLLLATPRLFGADRVLAISRSELIAVSPPDAGEMIDVRYVAPGGREALVRLGPFGWDARELHRALAAAA